MKTQFQYNQVKLSCIHILARLAYLISAKPLQVIKETGQNQNWIFLQLLNHNPNEAVVWFSISSYPLLMYSSKFSSSFRWGDLTSLFLLRHFLYLLCISFVFHIISYHHPISHTSKYKFGTAFVSFNCLDHCWRKSWQERLSFHVLCWLELSMIWKMECEKTHMTSSLQVSRHLVKNINMEQCSCKKQKCWY